MSVQAPPFLMLRRHWSLYAWAVPRFNWILDVSGTQPTSWWRDAETNRRVGGHPQSQHLLGFAFDAKGDPEQHQTAVAAADLLGMVGIDEGSHVHVQLYPAGTLSRLGLFT